MPLPGKKSLSVRINAAVLDVDGTIIISQPALAAMWKDFGKDKPYFDADYVTRISHGWRTFDAIAKFAPDFANKEFVAELEGSIPEKFGKFSVQVPGSVKFCNDLNNLPKQKWGVATSGTFEMASQWFAFLNIKRPDVFITASSVDNGKPDPECYIKARTDLGFPINKQDQAKSKVIVFEDAPAGIEAGKGAGCKIVGVATTFDYDFLLEKGCDIIIKDFESVKVGSYYPEQDEIEIIFTDYLFAKDDLLKE